MPIPDYQSLMLPLLNLAASEPSREFALQEAVHMLALSFGLTEEEKRELLPSGRQATFTNRVGWASTYLKKAGLLESPRRGYFRIAQRGQEVLAQKPASINVQFLEQFPEFIEFRTTRSEQKDNGGGIDDATNSRTPEESLELEYQKIREI